MRIALFLDSWWRDAYSIIPLKLELEKQGQIVDVVPFTLWNEYLQLIQPDHAVLNHAIGERNRKIIDIMRRHEGTVSVLPTEGRPNTQAQVDWYSSQDGLVDWIFHWSSQTEKGFKKTSGSITGCPRFLVYNEPVDKEMILHKHGLNTNRKTLLFATSFPQAKFHNINSQFNKKDWKDLSVPFDPDDVAKSEYSARGRALLLLSILAEETDYQIILRPHPMEDTRWWERFMPPSAHLITQEFVHNLIGSSDVVINRAGCMTTMEAWLANTPVLSVNYLENNLLSGPAKEVWNIQAHKRYYLNVLGNIPTEAEKQPVKILKKYGLLKENAVTAISDKIIEFGETASNKLSLPNLQQWSKILIEHNDRVIVPIPGFHPGKDAAKFRVDNLSWQLKEI